jgi:hypothetical protein
MNILIIIISLILIIILFKNKNKENMTDISDVKTKCCLIEKQYLPDNNSMYGGNFKYIYSPKENCNASEYELNNNKQLLIDGINNWSNNNCKNDDITLGSCRMNNFECIDFVDKPFCDKVNGMVWSGKTCQTPLDFNWQDKIIRVEPKKDTNDGSYVMFPEQFKKI